jgi:hypothetical protein
MGKALVETGFREQLLGWSNGCVKQDVLPNGPNKKKGI